MKKFFEILSMIALIIWGGIFIYFFVSGRVTNYLSASFRPWVPLAGVGMIGLGIFNLLTINRSTGACSHDHIHGDHSDCDHDDHHHHHDHDSSCDHDKSCDHDHSSHGDHSKSCDHDHGSHGDHSKTCDHDHDHDHGSSCNHDHDHDHHEPHFHDEATASSLAFALVILLVPMLSAVGFSKDAFSGDYTKKWAMIEVDMKKLRMRKAAAIRSAYESGELQGNPYANPTDSSDEEAWGTFTLEDLKKMVPQTSAGDFLLDVPQIFYTAGDQELMEVMEGIPVETTAQIIEDTFEDSGPNRLRAYRLLVECCAADARPLSIPIDFTESLPEYQEMGWYRLIGKLHFTKSEAFEYIPSIEIKTFEPTPEPAEWMGF